MDPLIHQLTEQLHQNSDSNVVELPAEAPFDDSQRQWLNGLLTGINTIVAAANAGQGAEEPGTPLHILYGSQSGNAEVLSKDLKKYAVTQGFEPTIQELDDVDLSALAEMQHVLIICSTFGEGEPPDNARTFYDALMSADAMTLPATLNFSVCGLGDSSYAEFNKCGQDINTRLMELGATPCVDIVACDVAFEDDYAEWKTAAFASSVFQDAAGAASTAPIEADSNAKAYDKNTPFIANLIHVEKLSGEGSAKTVNHIEISLAGGGDDMHYDVGDALGVWPLNCAEEVDAIIRAGGFNGSDVVNLKSGPASLRVALLTKLDISIINAKALETWGITAVVDGFQVFDMLSQLQPNLDAQTFVDGLRPLQPRLYSIASSPKKHPGEVHLTVGEVHYDLFGRPRKGVASTWLGERLSAGANIGVYTQTSAHFHIPSDDNAPLIMIGPGTGIAPFRAFLEEREAREAKGDNWLFFGDQHEAEDYLYRDQITAWQQSGLLTELSLAWSRDTDKKIYVQTLIREAAQTFFNWLENGAYIYICGDASRMASDVDTALRDVIASQGGLDEDGVNEYMSKLVSEHRYQRDVY